MVLQRLERRLRPSLEQMKQKISGCRCADKMSNLCQEKAGEVTNQNQRLMRTPVESYENPEKMIKNSGMSRGSWIFEGVSSQITYL